MSVRVRFPLQLDRKALDSLPAHGQRRNRVRWRCELETVTPLCIRTLFQGLESRKEKPFVPGSSLRGMFRNVVEALGCGCAMIYDAKVAAPHMKPCTRSTGLCFACRLFGMVNDKDTWMGQVRLTDTERAAFGANGTWVRHNMAGERTPAAAPDSKSWAWFEYDPGREPERGGALVCVPGGMKFQFTVEHWNLDPEEAAVLQFAVELRHRKDSFFHKLGFGKALGLGTVEVEILDDVMVPDPGWVDRFARDADIWDRLTGVR